MLHDEWLGSVEGQQVLAGMYLRALRNCMYREVLHIPLPGDPHFVFTEELRAQTELQRGKARLKEARAELKRAHSEAIKAQLELDAARLWLEERLKKDVSKGD